MLKVALSPLTNRIYCGKSDRKKSNTLIGKEDVTSDALRAVFGWLVSYYEHAESGEELIVEVPDTEYEIVVRKGRTKNEDFK